VIRHVDGGIHPEAEMTRHLTDLEFPNIAPLYGQVARIDEDGTSHVLMLLQGFVRNQGDAWSWSLETLKRALDEALVMGEDAETPGESLYSDYRNFAGMIGRRLAELHDALATPTDDPAFAPRPAGDAEVAGWVESARGQLTQAFDTLDTGRDQLEEACRELADKVLKRRNGLLSSLERLAEGGRGALMTRIHGDFHLGQVLVAQGDAFIIDFEGEPARTLEERRAMSSPLRDVAGLIRSFDYTAAAVTTPEDDSSQREVRDRRRALLQRFRREAEDAFLGAYDGVARQAAHPWVDAGQERPLIDLFTLEKVAYEVRYEAANRPKWLPIPLTGLARIADRLLGPEDAA
jgi:maltose alpha-D-glucosyltransferase/alpha-amylase